MLWRSCIGPPSQPKLALSLPIKGPSFCRLTVIGGMGSLRSPPPSTTSWSPHPRMRGWAGSGGRKTSSQPRPRSRSRSRSQSRRQAHPLYSNSSSVVFTMTAFLKPVSAAPERVTMMGWIFATAAFTSSRVSPSFGLAMVRVEVALDPAANTSCSVFIHFPPSRAPRIFHPGPWDVPFISPSTI